jgi:hypothetical protein
MVVPDAGELLSPQAAKTLERLRARHAEKLALRIEQAHAAGLLDQPPRFVLQCCGRCLIDAPDSERGWRWLCCHCPAAGTSGKSLPAGEPRRNYDLDHIPGFYPSCPITYLLRRMVKLR